jgi:hypothetical protein
LGLN